MAYLRTLFANPRGDLLGGLVAGIVALPLALAFGVASGLGAEAGLYGAIAVGILAALFGGTPAQVSGPTGPMTVVAAGIVAAYAGRPEVVFLAITMAGLMQIAFGALRLGQYIQYVPYPVISGFMTGIGTIIVTLQTLPLFGLKGSSSVVEGLQRLGEIPGHVNFAALGLGLGAIALVYGVPRVTKAVPATLVALVAMTGLSVALALDVPRIGPIAGGMPRLHLPPFDPKLWAQVAAAAATLAALGAIDSLLTSLVADRITRTRHDSDRELIGQGLGNALAGLVGGLPGAGATMRTVVNVGAGGRGPLSGAFHGVVLIAVLAGLGPLAATIPLAVLAGILVTVGLAIADTRGLRHLPYVPRADGVILLTVLTLTVFVDLIQAVGVGMVMACLLYVKRMSDREIVEAVTVPDLPDAEVDHFGDPDVVGQGVVVVPMLRDVFFGNANAVPALEAKVSGMAVVILDMSHVGYVDQSGVYALADLVVGLSAGGAAVYMAALRPQPERLLRLTGVAPGEVPPALIHATVDRCIAHALTRPLAAR